MINKDKLKKDLEEGLCEDKKAFNLLTTIVNTIDPEIQCKCEVPSDHSELGMAVPFLDTAVWVDHSSKDHPKGKIYHKFFEKLTNPRIVIQKESAINERAIRTIHTQEIIRILRNTSRDLPENLKIIGVNNYMKKLQNSGYDEEYRKEILLSGYTGYLSQCDKEDSGECPLYRSFNYKRLERNISKENQIKSWFTAEAK